MEVRNATEDDIGKSVMVSDNHYGDFEGGMGEHELRAIIDGEYVVQVCGRLKIYDYAILPVELEDKKSTVELAKDIINELPEGYVTNRTCRSVTKILAKFMEAYIKERGK